eukprot:3821812-Amphidinium_carterae.1
MKGKKRRANNFNVGHGFTRSTCDCMNTHASSFWKCVCRLSSRLQKGNTYSCGSDWRSTTE